MRTSIQDNPSKNELYGKLFIKKSKKRVTSVTFGMSLVYFLFLLKKTFILILLYNTFFTYMILTCFPPKE